MQTTFFNQMAHQQVNTDRFGQYNDNNECMKQLEQIEFDMMQQVIMLLQVITLTLSNEQNIKYKYNT